MTTTPANSQSGAAAFIHEVGQLKNTPRQGWLYLGIRQPESVADHSHRAAVIAFLLAALDGADPYKAAALALFHDVPEARSGDIATPARRYCDKPDEEQIISDQTESLPEPARKALRELMLEYLQQQTHEAQLARDADKLECLTQALEYQDQGVNGTQTWQHNSVEALRTPQGRSVATQLLANPQAHWWDTLMNPARQLELATHPAFKQQVRT